MPAVAKLEASVRESLRDTTVPKAVVTLALPSASPVLAELARALARMADRRVTAPIARELRAVLVALYESADDAPDELDAFLTSIRGPA